MYNFEFILEPYSGSKSRHTCPNCGKNSCFSLYIHIETSEPLAYNVGRCNREIKCKYHYTPKQYFRDNKIDRSIQKWNKEENDFVIDLSKKESSFIETEIFKSSLKGYDKNNFISFLIKDLGEQKTSRLIDKYFVGTSKRWEGATVFWQIDIEGKIRTGKVILYNPDSGKRIKAPESYITWVHKLLNLEEYNLNQCLFGEHLLKGNSAKPLAIVESEKTAIIASAYFEEFIWLATGGISSLTPEKCIALKNRNVVLYPDSNGFEKWEQKAKILRKELNCKIQISDLLERKIPAEFRNEGYDLADFLININSKELDIK
ncbi:DUF6371 domain-containing protein [Emticicia agri]|uniref:Toprim domain-containing protein n=1 Tax=Emticicia agri TaxID=2492393 RepID=A0A4Q5LXJ2_9BACT|nr:DUF6371 domain-containing protein [Emticicia agri]RYU94345.1 hypothetical protein EWM59_17625 [Emticicia agri]